MSTRQYVGARYVPTFANPIQWDSQRIYEPLTMVTYLNNTYTSKKPVPQGVDINNAEYWVLTGNYNAQVEQYRQEVESIRKTKTNAINIKELGAKGDGVTDDTVAINAAIMYAKVNNMGVYAPSGVYIVDGVVIPGNIAITGENKETVTFKLKNNSTTGCVFITENFDAYTNTNTTNGCNGVSFSNITIDGNKANNPRSYGLKKYGCRWVVDNISVQNCGESGIYTEWSTYAGAPADGRYMEDIWSNIRCHRNKDGFIYNGAHDGILYSIMLYLNDNNGFVCNANDKYSANGIKITNMHSYANGSDGIVLNAQVNAVNIVSESNNAQDGVGVGGSGIIVNANLCQLTGMYAYTNSNGTGLILNAGYCNITGSIIANKAGIKVVKDGGINSINLTVQSNENQTTFDGTPNLSTTSVWKVTGVGSDFNIVDTNFDVQMFDAPLPGGVGKDNKFINPRNYPIIGYQAGGDGMYMVDASGLETPVGGSGCFILMPKCGVYFNTTIPTYWKFKPMII